MVVEVEDKMSKNQTPNAENENENNSIITYEGEDASGVAELRTPASSKAEATFRAAMNGETRLHQRVMSIVREHNDTARGTEGMMEIPEEIINLPAMPSVQRDDEDRPYIEDLNTVVRYYLDVGEVEMTEDFIENAQTVDSNERTNTFAKMYNVA